MTVEAVIFDLDGVIVSTDDYHYQGWKKLADEEGIYFDRDINERLRGVSRMESLEILLERADREYSQEEKQEMCTRKNGYYRELLTTLTAADLLPGVKNVLDDLRLQSVKMAIGSSSRNTPIILKNIGLDDWFDAVSDGNNIERSKPFPDVFQIAADRLGVDYDKCLVVEDAEAGVTAALAAGMKALAVGFAAGDERAHLSAQDLSQLTVADILQVN
jgi:beta-phosphoglucomutase